MQSIEKEQSDRLRTEREAVQSFYRAFTEQDTDVVDEVLAPGWQDIPLAPGQVAGPAGIKTIIKSLAASFPDVKIVIHDLVQEPGKIGVRAEISGTHQGDLFGIAATGRKASFRLHEFHTLEDGKVTTTWHMEDWFGLFQQLGQFPEQGS